MKQWLKSAKMLLMLPLAFLMVNCSGKSNNNNNANNYYMSNGMCWSRANGAQVNQSYCNGLTSSQYYLSNGQCYSSLNGQPVQYTLCQMGNGGMGQQCYGMYWYYNPQYGQWIQGQCYGSNCSGYTMYLQQGGQPIYCQ